MVVKFFLGFLLTKVVLGVVAGKKEVIPKEILDTQASYRNSIFIDENDAPEDDAIIVNAKAEESANGTECRLEYKVVESVHYSEVQTTECRSYNVTSCDTLPYEECHTQLREECHQGVREECQDKVEEKCDTKYRTEHSQEAVRECDRECQYRWEGTGGDKRWVVDPSTCICEDITRKTVAKVPFLACTLISRKECKDVPVRECEEVKERICEQKEREECKEVPHKECKDIHRKVPNTITRNVPVQVCTEEDGGKEEEKVGKEEGEQDLRKPREILIA